MYLNHSVAVVVPAFNEERLLARTIASIPDWVDRVIIVDDTSQDNTANVACSFVRKGLIVAQHKENKGVGASIVTGYQIALQHHIDIVAVMAGDAQMDPADLPALLQPLIYKTADYAKGNRLAHPEVLQSMPTARRIGTYLLALLTRPLSGYWSLTDSQCGYTAITKEALQILDLPRLYPRYGYPNDLLIQLGTRKQRLAQVTVRPVYGDEVSGFRPATVAPRLLYVLSRALLLRIQYELCQKRSNQTEINKVQILQENPII